MRLHRNAKTTPAQRQLIVDRYLNEGWDVPSLADAVGVSQRTVWKWIRRFREEGREGLEDRSSAPRAIPHRTSTTTEFRIKKLRHKRLAAWQISRMTGVARSTVSAVLCRLGLNRLKVLEPKEPTRSYEHDFPGSLLHLDVKKLARFRKTGHRIHGDRTRITRGAGWEYLHVCIDDHSRVAYVEVLDDEKGNTAASFLDRAVRWFAHLGIRTHRVLTDNGSCYRSGVFNALCEHMGIRHRYTRPYRPQTNGKAERFIQTLLREWAYARAFRTSTGRRRSLPSWLRHYNHVRPHGSLGMDPPMTRIASG